MTCVSNTALADEASLVLNARAAAIHVRHRPYGVQRVAGWHGEGRGVHARVGEVDREIITCRVGSGVRVDLAVLHGADRHGEVLCVHDRFHEVFLLLALHRVYMISKPKQSPAPSSVPANHR